MDSNLVSLNRVFLNLTTPANRELVFTQGEVLRGLIQEVNANGLAKLLIQGQLLEAMAEAQVSKGQSLYLLVEEVRPGRISLKILSPEAVSRMEQANLAGQLKELGVNPGPDTVKLARVLLENQLPVNRQTLGEGTQILHRLGGATPQNLALTALVIKSQLPANPALLERLVTFFQQQDDIGKLYGSLNRMLNQLAPAQPLPQSLPPAAPSAPGPPADLLRPIPPQIPLPGGGGAAEAGTSARLEPSSSPGPPAAGGGSPERPAAPSGPAAAFSVRPEAAPGANLTGRTEGQAASASRPETANQPVFDPARPAGANQEFISRLLQHVRTLASMVEVEAGQPARQLEKSFQQIIQNRPEVFRGLAAAQTLLEQVRLGTAPEWRETLSLLKNLEHELSGQQIVSTAGRLSPESNFSGIYLSFPLKLAPDQYTVCELKIHSDQKRMKSDPDNVRLAISLDTSRMGVVLFHVEWKRAGTLNIQGVVESEPVRSHFLAHWQEFSHSLEKLGYQVNNLGIKTVPPGQQTESLRPGLELLPAGAIRPISIDITV